jgi:ABC-2 type transport system permease protein
MLKYWHVLKIGMQNNLTYRFNFLARTLFGFIPLLAILSVWRAIYEGNESQSVGPYAYSEMISYYLLATVIDALTAVNEDDWQIAADIKDGNISQFLLKPIDYLRYRLALFFAGRVSYIAVAAVPVILLILFFREHFVWPATTVTCLAFAFSVGLTAMLQFFISYAMAMLAFWVLEVSTFIFILFAFEYIASGHLFPLDILPPGVRDILFLTPFPYQLYFPASVYLGKVAGMELWKGLIIQTGWVIAAYFMARFAWSRGIRKYAAAGG